MHTHPLQWPSLEVSTRGPHAASTLPRETPRLPGTEWHTLVKQECIPVGCVPTTAVAIFQGEGQTPPPPWTNTCENITIPCTSYAVGKYYLPVTSLEGGNKQASILILQWEDKSLLLQSRQKMKQVSQ